MTDNKLKIEFIARKINTMSILHKEHVCKILMAHDIVVHQSNNGAYCWIRDLSTDIIDVVHEYIVMNLK